MGKEGATPQLTSAKEGNAIVLPLLITPHHLFASQTTAKSAVSRVILTGSKALSYEESRFRLLLYRLY